MKRMMTVIGTMAMCAAALWAQTTPATRPATHGERPAATFPAGVPAPIITDKFTADPHGVVIGDTYYVYPTVDKENWATTEFNVWSSKDLIHWKDEGVIIDLAGTATGKQDVPWAKIRAWAPGVIARDGKVYDYFCADTNIGVAVADKPTGPFKDVLGKPLVAKGAFPGQMIDPCPFIDDDGQAYLFWGNGNLYVARLGKDMVSLEGEVKTITPRWQGGGRFNEGIFVFKRKGTYYFSWSENDARADNYQCAYGTATSPLGPIQLPSPVAARLFLENDKRQDASGRAAPLVKGTGHHSIINVPGTDDWYVFYHRHAVPGGNGFIRETCLSKLEFAPNPAGGPDIIKPVDVVHPAFAEGSTGEPVPAGR
jgi:large repetitive protein